MKRSGILLVLAAALATTACNEETRTGGLTLTGSAPLRIADQEGRTVEFFTGPLKVVFDAESGRKVSVKLEQNGRAAKFTAKIPSRADWNFTVKGSDIGQPVDLASTRKVELYGPIYTRIGSGGPCGFDGTYQTEERWQSGNEDWNVAFSDAGTGQPVAAFKSRREGESYLIESRELWCRERHRHEPFPRGGRWDRASQRINNLNIDSVKFD